jgi:uncharacterized protein (TIGR03067 family)
MTCLGLGLLFATSGAALAADDAKKHAIQQDLKKLEGSWRTVSIEVNGKKLSEENIKQAADLRLVFKGNTGSIRNKDIVVSEGTFTIDPTKKPKTLDLKITKGQNNGKTSLAIYELDGDTLKACWTLFAVDRKRPKEFATKPDSGLLLITYKREKK